MDTANLQVFIKVVERRSLSAVADELFMSVSGVSMLIDRLEHRYGAQLLVRRGRGVAPTIAGEMLYEYANEVIEAEHRLERELNYAREIDPAGWVRIGATRAVARDFLPPILSEFKASHPEVHVRIEAGSLDVITPLLLSRRVDFACMAPQEHEQLTNTRVRRERLLIIAPPGDPMVQRGVVSTEEILQRRFVIANSNPGIRYRVALEDALGCTGRAGLMVALEVDDEEALKEAVLRGLGCGLISDTLVARELQSGLLCEIIVDGISLAEEVCLIRRKHSALSDPATLLYNMILPETGPAGDDFPHPLPAAAISHGNVEPLNQIVHGIVK